MNTVGDFKPLSLDSLLWIIQFEVIGFVPSLDSLLWIHSVYSYMNSCGAVVWVRVQGTRAGRKLLQNGVGGGRRGMCSLSRGGWVSVGEEESSWTWTQAAQTLRMQPQKMLKWEFSPFILFEYLDCCMKLFSGVSCKLHSAMRSSLLYGTPWKVCEWNLSGIVHSCILKVGPGYTCKCPIKDVEVWNIDPWFCCMTSSQAYVLMESKRCWS